jgi:hypothetical protein
MLVSRTTSNLLLTSLYEFDIQRQNGSALHWAARHEKLYVAEVMLRRYQPDVDAVYHTCTPLVHATIHGSESTVKIRLSNPRILVNFQNEQGQCALCCRNSLKLLRIYCSVPISKRSSRRENMAPPHWPAAVAKRRAIIVKRLIQTGRADVNAPDGWRRTPIFHAISRQDSAIIEILLADDRLDLAWQDELGRTPLIYSVLKGQTVLTKLLLGHPKPYVDIRDPDDRTALWHAVQQGDEVLIQLLVDRGSIATATIIDRLTPLHLSIRQENLSMVQKWSRNSCRDHPAPRPGAPHGTNNEPPPLCLATSQGSEDIVRLLLDHRWKVNEVDADGPNTIAFDGRESGSCNRLGPFGSHTGRFVRAGPVGIDNIARCRQARALVVKLLLVEREHRYQRQGHK